jgi:hypothetical protein
LGFVDYEKAFDSIEVWAVLEGLNEARIDSRYSSIIQKIYENATMHVSVNEDWKTNSIPIKRGVRQGDPISPKLFNTALEYALKKVEWHRKGVNIDGKYLSHLRFADDIVVISSDPEELAEMLQELHEQSKKVGLKMNLTKTKVMSPDSLTFRIDQTNLETVQEYVYLGHKMKLGRENQTADLFRRTGLAWAAFSNMKHVLKNKKVPLCMKRKVFDACILPVFTYGAETMTLTKASVNKLSVTQRAMERAMLGISLRDRVRNQVIRARSKVKDVAEVILAMKWRWAGHVARDDEDKWTKRLLCWRPRTSSRSAGRPQLRWRDDLVRFAGPTWMRDAQNRTEWRGREEAYIQHWMATG